MFFAIGFLSCVSRLAFNNVDYLQFTNIIHSYMNRGFK